MTPINLTPKDVIDLEEADHKRRSNAAIEGPVALQRPEFPARSPAETLDEAESADYRWLEASRDVLERSLLDAGRENAALKDSLGWACIAAISGWGAFWTGVVWMAVGR